MQKEESRTDLGIIRIHKNVIASIASLAASEIEGVKGIGKDIRTGILELLGKKSLVAIHVEIDKNNEIRLDLPLIIKYGFNIPDVANRVQENVRAALEKMTNLSVKDININVQGIERN
ncbi:MAG: Asp23/Gls24 family envelope stress response protein [Candidatus Omnitrophica bacterium]|nr:Asp23/Gls24 family envelope stress response protein [Candidatus Omnitrophota bacterium]